MSREPADISIDAMKRAAAAAALAELPHEGVVGLGTGSTIRFFLAELSGAIRAGRRLTGVPTSEETRLVARSLGIPLLGDEGPWSIAVTVDGADEVTSELELIKGLGGALAREKIVSAASGRNIIVVDETKLSRRLGETRPIPIEVLAFGHLTTRDHLRTYGEPVARIREGAPVRTDAGNLIYDLAVSSIQDARVLESNLRSIPGVIATGLFLALADLVLVGTRGGVVRLTPPAIRPDE